MATDYDLQDRLKRIESMSHEDAINLVYEWTKTGVINRRQFAALILQPIINRLERAKELAEEK